MCISNNQYSSPRVDFKDTILYGAQVRTARGEIEHVLGYFNKVAFSAEAPVSADFGWEAKPAAAGNNDFGWDVAPPAQKHGNAMIFAVPAIPGSMNEKSLIPTSKIPEFMKDLKRAVTPRPPVTRGGSKGMLSFGGASDNAIVVKDFDDGLYDVIIASGGAKSLARAIGQVAPEKRPETINEKLYAELDICYPNFTFVLACFAEADAARAGCMLMSYKPMRPDLLFLPGLDGHNGAIDRGNVKLNHTLVVGSFDMKAGIGFEVDYSHNKGDGLRIEDALRETTYPYCLLKQVIGKVIPDGTVAPQGDFLFSVDEVKAGIFRCRRALPPGFAKLEGAVPEAQSFYITTDSMGTGRSRPGLLGRS